MRVKFIGLKHISGENANGKFDFHTACFTSEMSEKAVKNGGVGLDVHTPSVPDKFKDVLCGANVGKDMDCEFYWVNGKEVVVACQLAK